jgi:transcriptional regulator with XRE-family HTH domain
MRKMLRLSQTDFGDLCGVSRARISAIECGEVKMTWYQFNAFLLVLVVNPETRKYITSMNIFPKRLFCFYQRKDENELPEGFDY